MVRDVCLPASRLMIEKSATPSVRLRQVLTPEIAGRTCGIAYPHPSVISWPGSGSLCSQSHKTRRSVSDRRDRVSYALRIISPRSGCSGAELIVGVFNQPCRALGLALAKRAALPCSVTKGVDLLAQR